MQRRKRSSSSLKTLPRLVPYLSVSCCHALSYFAILLRSASCISSRTASFFSPSRIFFSMRSHSARRTGPRSKSASLYAVTSSTVLPSTSRAIFSTSRRPYLSAARMKRLKSVRPHVAKPASRSARLSASSAAESTSPSASASSPLLPPCAIRLERAISSSCSLTKSSWMRGALYSWKSRISGMRRIFGNLGMSAAACCAEKPRGSRSE
mmetsp:Transcript_5326/g.16707  ORF Transcript_5326/g.16707 Transcript_5326/m.16707 type:complete len:209 (-) Transcript_5326:555-1181(-)